ncbi:uncharacterized protein IL334_004658 [Kwoniella shivajii]|uniref:Uncharacterized protein n=1 Tax=Kwoniella shivajii TaxID=564305 RepID=A0ABZ1D3Y9_9TREE|nr:hypothetical protein IL334_004658 [Kwoniella shivajii]
MSFRAATLLLRSARSANFRTLHTSISSFNSADLPPTPSSAEALGFKTQNRQRVLPADLKINISASGKRDLVQDNEKKPRHDNKRSGRITLVPRPQKEVFNSSSQEADFFSGSDLTSTSTPESRRSSSSAPRSRRALKGVSMDVVDSALPPDVARRQRRENNSQQRSRPGQGKGRSAGGKDRKSRDVGINVNSREKRVMLPRRQLTLDVMDHSEQGLFGKNPLVIQSQGNGIFSTGLGHPRKSSSIRQTSSTSAFPTSPIPILSTIPARSTEQAIQIASWSAALNGSIAPRVKSRLSDTVKAQLGR